MTALLMLQAPSSEAVGKLVALLERYRDASPLLEEELARQRVFTHTLAEHKIHGERALSAWRTALSRRWECEVFAQRAYRRVQRLLAEHYGDDSSYAALLGSSHKGAGSTPSDLLQELRRLDVALGLLAPRPPFADAASAQLRQAGDELEVAIDHSLHCESERRSVLTEQRITMSLYERAYDRARRLLANQVGDQALALPPVFVYDDRA